MDREEARRVIREYTSKSVINWPEGMSIQEIEKFYTAIRKAKQDALAQVFLGKKVNTFSNLIMKSLDTWEGKKRKELRMKRKKLLKDAKEITIPKATDYNAEQDPLVKRVKVILASKMAQLKRLIKKHPFVAKYIYNQLGALSKSIKRGNYKQAIIFINDLIARAEQAIADEEGKVVMLELAKAEGEAKASIVRTMDALVERLQLDESQLLGKEDGLSSDCFAEEEEDEEQVKKEYFSGEEDWKEAKPSKPPKIKQIGISQPIKENEDRSILTTFPVEFESEQKKKEDKKREKEKAKQESKLSSLKENFEDLTKEERTKLIQSLLKRKLRKMKEVE